MNNSTVAPATGHVTDGRRTIVIPITFQTWPDGEFRLVYTHADSEYPYYEGKTQRGQFWPLSLVPHPCETTPHPGRSAQPGEVWRFEADADFGYRSPSYEYVGLFIRVRQFYDPETGAEGVELHEVTAGRSARAQRISANVKRIATAAGLTSADLARKMGLPVEEVEHVLDGNLEFTLRHMLEIADALGMDPFEMVGEVSH